MRCPASSGVEAMAWGSAARARSERGASGGIRRVIRETAHHVLFDCDATAHLRGSPAYASLFTPELLAAPRMRTWVHLAPQHLLAQYTHACFQIFQPS